MTYFPIFFKFLGVRVKIWTSFYGNPKVHRGEVLVTVARPVSPQKKIKVLMKIVNFPSYAKNRPSKKLNACALNPL